MIGVFLVLFVVLAQGSTPVPDSSQSCIDCKKQVTELNSLWSNATSVEEILANLESECKRKYKLVKKEICDKIAETVVKIPPKIFEGMEGLAWDIPVATCATIHKCTTNCCSSDSVEQVHLSLTSKDRTQMGVSWVTLNAKDTIVEYSKDEEKVGEEGASSATGSTNTYSQAGWIGTIHKAMMTDLEPATTYYYRVGSPADAIWSPVFSFRTFDPSAASINYAVIADMGYGENSDHTIERLHDLVMSGEIDMVIHNGDIGYADGYMAHWDTFLNKVQPIASRVPYMVTPGNHEFWYNFAAYKARFYMPSNEDNGKEGDGSGDNMYYSWDYGNVHFAAMNSETAIDEPDFHKDQLKWFSSDLSAVDRQQTPFVIAHFHRPLYCSNDKQCTRTADAPNRLTKQAEELFYSSKVNLVLTGHVHDYERSAPVHKGETSSPSGASDYVGPVYILQGSSGNREGNKGSWPDDLPDWSVAHSADIGYGVLRVSQGEHPKMDWTFYRSEDNAIEDQATIS